MFGWPLVVVFGLCLFYYHTRLAKLKFQHTTLQKKSAETDRTLSAQTKKSDTLLDLLTLRHRLLQEAKMGHLQEASLSHLLGKIDQSLVNYELEKNNIIPDTYIWKERSLRAWRALEKRGDMVSGPPPWEKVVAEAEVVAKVLPPEMAVKSIAPVQEEIEVDSEEITTTAETDTPVTSTPQAAPKVTPGNAKDHAWQAKQASELEKALQHISGWPKILLPFFVQNLGWFIGGFCFLAGAIFLVSYTSGFVKGLTVFFALFSYTLFLIWFGYRLRQKHSTVKTGGGVLMTMGLLLVPLNISALVRLIVSSNGNLLHTAVGWLLVVFALAIYYYLAKLIAGMIDRALQGFYPVVFLLLTSIQLAVPLLDVWPIWYLMALFHILLLGLLSYGFYRYANDWMRSIFVEQKNIAYFAGGVLLYSACVSFVHLTWGVDSLATPLGYYAPYMMAICGLLFYLESKFKEWVKQSVSLSRLTFVIYGLSIVALFVAKGGGALTLTLYLGVVLYGLVVWRYHTLTPLYLVLASLAGLYYILILNHFSWDLHFLLSVPALSALFYLSHFIRKLEDERFAVYRLGIILYRIQTLLFFVLAVWSLFNSRPGVVGFGSAVLLTAGSWWILQYAPGALLRTLSAAERFSQETADSVNLNNSPWFYIVIIATTSALAFVPIWGNVTWQANFAGGLMVLACLWTWLAIRYRLLCKNALAAKIEVLANSALLSVVGALVLVVPNTMAAGAGLFEAVLCGMAALILLSLSLGFYVGWLFYGFLILIGAAVGFIKLIYFPGTSVGLMKILLGFGLWIGIWWLQRQPDAIDTIRRERLRLDVVLRLLWVFPISPGDEESTAGIESQSIEGGGADV